jgi:hypothetical protein
MDWASIQMEADSQVMFLIQQSNHSSPVTK